MAGTMDWLDLAGRSCVITGAGGGIGNAMARTFAAAGTRLMLLDQDADRLQALADELQAGGADVLTRNCNVADPASVEAAAAAADDAFGGGDILVNNAGILRAGSLADVSFADWNLMLSINLTGYFLCAQAFGRAMRANGRGSIVHVGSISGQVPQGFSGAYSVSKAGVSMLSRGLAVEWGEYGVRSNLVCPAMIRTPMSEALYVDPAITEKRKGAVPMRRVGTPEDIAEAAAFLASDRASYITGEEMLIDGGFRQNMLGLVPRPGFDRQPA